MKLGMLTSKANFYWPVSKGPLSKNFKRRPWVYENNEGSRPSGRALRYGGGGSAFTFPYDFTQIVRLVTQYQYTST